MTTHTGKYKAAGITTRWAVVAVVALALLFRLALLSRGVYPFNSDEAIVALMARHILSGRWPVFFYGQAYMGSLDATLVALGFMIFGQEIWVIRLVQLLLFVGIVLTSMRLATKLTHNKSVGLVAGLLLAIPTVNLNLYTTISLGGYGEALLIGNLLLLLGYRLGERARDIWLLSLWGVLAGIGFWAFGLTLIYTIPTLIAILLYQRREGDVKWILPSLGLITVGFALGAAPIGFWVFRHGPTLLIQELFGEAIAGTVQGGYWTAVIQHVLNLLIFGVTAILGFRPPWGTRIFFWPLAIVVSLFWIAVILQYVRILRGKGVQIKLARLFAGVAFLLVIGFILTPFGGDPSGRYFLPLNVILAIIASGLFMQDSGWLPSWLKWSLLCAVIVYHLCSNLLVAFRLESGFTTQFDAVTRIDRSYDQDLIRFLEKEGELRGYTNYWVAYPLAFKSDEEIIFVPRLPYHEDLRFTPRDNRYAPYNPIVEESDQTAFITTNNPSLDQLIRSRFEEMKVSWKEESIGDFHIFYGLSKKIRPEAIDVRFQP